MVRAYAKLKDGSVKYNDVETVTIFDVADVLYKNGKMGTKSAHEYLYDKILTKVEPSYEFVDYDWTSSIVKPE